MTFAILDAPRPRPAPPPAGIAREISYAPSAATRPARAVIRAIEALTGRGALIRRAAGYEDDLARGHDFWRVMADRFGLRLEILAGSLEAIPREGPLVVVANHPFGILDGLVMGHILAGARGRDFRILAHEVFARARVLDGTVLPVDFRGGEAALRTNLATRAAAVAALRAGGAVGVFPGGTVSTAAKPFARPMDPAWRAFTARLVVKSGATVVPIWFEGANSPLFQIASHVNQTLRTALLIREFRRRLDRPVRLAIGAPIGADEIAACAQDGREVMDFLRRRTYALSPKPLDADLLGYEFEAHHKKIGKSMAVGVFDLGLGGLTVLEALARRLPDVPFVYYGDNANTPYGTRTADDIFRLTCAGTQRLFDAGCDLVILACNTASAAALKRMQETWVPEGKRVLGVFVPLIEALTERQWGDNSPPREVAVKHVALFATPATVASRAFQRELAFRAIGVDVEAQPCGGVVDAIEAGDLILAEALVHSHVEALRRRMPLPEAAVLGCTHYPLVEDAFRAALGPEVAVYSQPELVAASLENYLSRRPEMVGPGRESLFLTTGDPVAVGHKATLFLRRRIPFQAA